MSSRPLVSVVTPTYNHERFIAQCIESVLAQTYPHWEMIIVDDGSTDKTAEIVKRYQDPRIRYFHQEHQGPFRLGETYNFALRQSQGDLIAILEGDDWWPPDKLEKMVPLFENPKVVLAHGNSYWVIATQQGKELRLLHRPAESFPQEALENRPVGKGLEFFLRLQTFTSSVTVVIRKATLEMIGGFIQEPYLPLVDFTTYLHLGLRGEFAYLDDLAGFWRKRAGSITMTRNKEIIAGFGKAATDFVRQNRERLRELNIRPEELLPEIEATAAAKLRTIFENMASWADLFLAAGDFATAHAIYRDYWRAARRPRHFVVMLLGLASTYLHLNLLGAAKQDYRFLKSKCGSA